MKEIVFSIALLLGISASSFSQDYHPFINNSVWVIYLPGVGTSDFHTIGPATDVVVDGVAYKKYIDTSYGNQEVLIREELQTKRVYRRVGDADVLLYDFSVSVGDPVTVGSFGYNVTSITNIQMADGTTRKKISLNSFVASETWIEGVGNFKNPLRTVNQLTTNPTSELLCSYQQNVNIFNLGQYLGGIATDCLSLGTNSVGAPIPVGFSPNPFALTTTLFAAEDISDATVLVFDQVGRLVKKVKPANHDQVELSGDGLTPGIYIVHILKGSKILLTQKLYKTE